MTATAGGVARSSPSVLVVAGEASGDRLAARIALSLAKRGVRCFGMGGPACRAAGVELVADLRRSAAMGLTEVVARLPAIVNAFARVAQAANTARPEAAVLVDYTEFNLRMGVWLRRRGIPVLWCVAPQVWAWRPERMAHAARALDRLAVILPFETSLWQAQGVDAHYVGHPALDVTSLDRSRARERLGLCARPSVAVLPGSRPHEVHRHLPAMLAALRELEAAGMTIEARILAAASLDRATRCWLDTKARKAALPVLDTDPDAGATAWLSAFDAALTASGTATLECALACAPPVVVYRMSPITAAIARRLVTTKYVALPNIVLGAAVYPELLDRDAQPQRMAKALARVIEHRATFAVHAQDLRARLAWQATSVRSANVVVAGETSADRAASLLATWLPHAPSHSPDPKMAERPNMRAAPASPAP